MNRILNPHGVATEVFVPLFVTKLHAGKVQEPLLTFSFCLSAESVPNNLILSSSFQVFLCLKLQDQHPYNTIIGIKCLPSHCYNQTLLSNSFCFSPCHTHNFCLASDIPIPLPLSLPKNYFDPMGSRRHDIIPG